jgi:hypothetical protein
MSGMITPLFCRDRFTKLIKAVHDWERNDSSDILVPWMQSRVKGFSQSLEIAFETFLDETADAGRDVAPDARLFICRIDQLAHEYDRFKRGIAEESPSCSPGGTDGLWRAFRNVEEAFKQTQNLAKPQPVRQMLEDGVTVMQIATIYGWIDEYGNPDVEKVYQEQANPGTHFDPKTWVHPALKSRQSIINEEWQARTLQHPNGRRKVFTLEEFKPKSNWVPPSLESMVQAGAPAEQIAQVHGITVTEAQDLLNEANQTEAGLASV